MRADQLDRLADQGVPARVSVSLSDPRLDHTTQPRQAKTSATAIGTLASQAKVLIQFDRTNRR